MGNNTAAEQGHREFKERLDSICVTYADKTAITYMRDDGSRTLFKFGEIHECIKAAKEQFTTAGLHPGDRVAIIAPHSPYAIIAGLALAYSNITSVLIDATLPVEEINRLVGSSDVRAVFTVSNIYDCLDRTLIEDILVFDIKVIANKLSAFNDSILKAQKAATVDPHLDVIAILFSSGTTVSVKGVMITYHSIISLLPMLVKLSGMRESTRFLFVLPFSHISGYSCAMAFIFNHCELGMIEDVDATKLSKGFLHYEPTHFSMIPRVYEVIEQKIRQNINSKGKPVEKAILGLLSFSGFFRKYLHINIGRKIFKKITHKVFGENIYGLAVGAMTVKESTTKFFLNLGLKWANTYATTETGVPAITTGDFDNYPVGNEGNVNNFEGIKIKIHDPDENGIGEIRIKTVLIMKGYFRDPELTAAAFDEDGYFKTGDLGYIDKKDYLHVTGRIKEAIMMHTGKKVAPSDVDSFYSAHCPDVTLASCGVPNKDGTYDEIHLFVEKGERSPEEQQELQKSLFECSAQTSTLYQVSDIHFIDKLPLTSIGKVKRFQLKELALAMREGG